MKNLLIILASVVFLGAGIYESEIIFKRSGDRKIENFNTLKKMEDVSVIQTSVYFQNITKRGIFVTERNALGNVLGKYAGSKSGGNAASAELVAYLVFSDGEPADSDYQKITDDFYTYLNNKLTANGIKAESWEKFAASKYYDQIKDEKDDDKTVQEFRRKGNAWKIYTANNGPRPIRYNPMNHNYNAPAVRGTLRMANYGKEANVGTLFALNLVVDFADIFLEGDASSGTTERAFSTVEWKKSTVKYAIAPHLRVTSRDNGGSQTFVFQTSNKTFDEIYNATDIRSSHEMTAGVEQDPGKVKSEFLSVSIGQKHDIDPFVVEVTKEVYFENVKNALEKYADEFVKTLVSVKQ